MSGVRVRSMKGVSKTATDVVRAVVRAIQKVTSIEHAVDVRIAPAPAIESPDGKCGFGVFSPRDDRPVVYIGGGMIEQFIESGMTEKEACGALVSTVAHEFAHYEQYRDGKPLTERGVVVRTRSLVRELYRVADLGRWALLEQALA